MPQTIPHPALVMLEMHIHAHAGSLKTHTHIEMKWLHVFYQHGICLGYQFLNMVFITISSKMFVSGETSQTCNIEHINKNIQHISLTFFGEKGRTRKQERDERRRSRNMTHLFRFLRRKIKKERKKKNFTK